MKIAVIGGGLFGCTAAIYAARAGHKVTLFEKNSDIMQEATRVNQFRLHEGYHYPRSQETVEECQESIDPFLAEYGDTIDVSFGEKFYAIARGSKTSAEQYVDFMDRNSLGWELVPNRQDLFNYELLEAVFSVDEDRIHYPSLKAAVREKLQKECVEVWTGMSGIEKFDMKGHFDQYIVAGYASTNEILTSLGCEPVPIQYELVEKPQILLPKKYGCTSAVVMDGPFGCIDPYHQSGVHQMGHVKYSVRAAMTGTQFLDENEITASQSKWRAMAGSLGEYLPPVQDACRINSQFVVRAVLPNVDDTDERPTIVRRHSDRVISIFSGKLGHAVKAAQESVTMLDDAAD